MHALRCIALLATAAALSATTKPAAKPGNEAALAAVATPLKPSNDLGQDLLNNGVARVNDVVDKDVCRELRAEVEQWLAVQDAVPEDARFVPGTRLSLSTPMRLSFAGSRADLLLPIEEPVVSKVAATAIRACLAGVERARGGAAAARPWPGAARGGGARLGDLGDLGVLGCGSTLLPIVLSNEPGASALWAAHGAAPAALAHRRGRPPAARQLGAGGEGGAALPRCPGVL